MTPAIYDKVSGLLLVEPEQQHIVLRKDEKAGLINSKGEEIIPLAYKSSVNFDRLKHWYIMQEIGKYSKYGMIDSLNNVMILLEYSCMVWTYTNEFYKKISTYNIAIQKNRGNKWALADTEGKPITPFVYDQIKLFEKGSACTTIGDTTSYFLSSTGHVVHSVYNCKDIQDMKHFVVIIKYDSISEKGMVNLYNYDSCKIKYTAARSVILVTKDKFKGVVDANCKLILNSIYKDIQVSPEGTYIVATSEDNQSAIFDSEGKILRPFGKEYLSRFIKDMFIFSPL